jgi:hypothetical protein
MRRRLQRLNDAVCRDPTERGRLLGMRMPTPLGAVIDSMKAASSRASPGVGSRGHRLTLWLLTPCRRATLFEEPERGIGFAPDVLYHRADARPRAKRRTADLEVEVVRDISDGAQAGGHSSVDSSW